MKGTAGKRIGPRRNAGLVVLSAHISLISIPNSEAHLCQANHALMGAEKFEPGRTERLVDQNVYWLFVKSNSHYSLTRPVANGCKVIVKIFFREFSTVFTPRRAAPLTSALRRKLV